MSNAGEIKIEEAPRWLWKLWLGVAIAFLIGGVLLAIVREAKEPIAKSSSAKTPTLQKKTPELQTTKPSAPAPKPEQKIVPLSFGVHEVSLKGFGDNDWVPEKPFYFPAKARPFYKGPDSVQFRLEANGAVDLISIGCKEGYLLQRGVKFRGPKGEKLIIKILPESS